MYPTIATACAIRVALFSWRFIIPLVIFVLCYWKIISSLRRRAKVAASQQQQQQPAAGPSTSTAASRGQSKAPSKTQKNVIKTMIVIISCFTVCWLPVQLIVVGQFCGLRAYASMAMYYGLGIMSLFNLSANPFIYSTRMYPFLRVECVAWLRRLVRRGNQASDVSVDRRVGHIESGRRCGVTKCRDCKSKQTLTSAFVSKDAVTTSNLLYIIDY